LGGGGITPIQVPNNGGKTNFFLLRQEKLLARAVRKTVGLLTSRPVRDGDQVTTRPWPSSEIQLLRKALGNLKKQVAMSGELLLGY